MDYFAVGGSMEIVREWQRASDGEFGKAPPANRHHAVNLLQNTRGQHEVWRSVAASDVAETETA
jgi:hypothetical protein